MFRKSNFFLQISENQGEHWEKQSVKKVRGKSCGEKSEGKQFGKKSRGEKVNDNFGKTLGAMFENKVGMKSQVEMLRGRVMEKWGEQLMKKFVEIKLANKPQKKQ